jgi:predicted PurR-regulated permease PerM
MIFAIMVVGLYLFMAFAMRKERPVVPMGGRSLVAEDPRYAFETKAEESYRGIQNFFQAAMGVFVITVVVLWIVSAM